jgi:hypothetical protein
VKVGLQNIKGVLRAKLARKKAARRAEAAGNDQAPAPASAVAPLRTTGPKGLVTLEYAIDDCLAAAKHLDREGLAAVIALLRQARNAVVRNLTE